MAEMAKNQGAEVLIFSSMHETGQRERFTITAFSTHGSSFPPIELNQLTGIAAILTFPLDVDLVETEEREAKEEAERASAEQNG
jgi:protein pelota